MTAPLQVMAVSFVTGTDFQGRVLEQVDQLQGRGVVRLLDMVVVTKDRDGVLERLSIGDGEDFGSLLAAIVPVGESHLTEWAVSDGWAGFDVAEARTRAESLQPGTGLAFLPRGALLGRPAVRRHL